MATKRAVFLLGRHGQTPDTGNRNRGDCLDDSVEAVHAVYQNVVAILGEDARTYRAERSFGVYSPTTRTLYTTQAGLIAAVDILPREGHEQSFPPRFQADLSSYDFSTIDMIRDERFALTRANDAVYKRNNRDATENIDYWLAHPEATTHEGVDIAPFGEVYAETANGLREHIARFHEEQKDCGVLSSHACRIETAVIVLLQTAGPKIGAIADIGGVFERGEFAKLCIDTTEAGLATTLYMRGKQYKVDVSRL